MFVTFLKFNSFDAESFLKCTDGKGGWKSYWCANTGNLKENKQPVRQMKVPDEVQRVKQRR